MPAPNWPERTSPRPSLPPKTSSCTGRSGRSAGPRLPEVQQQSWVRNRSTDSCWRNWNPKESSRRPRSRQGHAACAASTSTWSGCRRRPKKSTAFVADTRPDAYEETRRPAAGQSPHYGEKQAMHWLDAARYADSDGYERDPQRPYAWRWRDWVIHALNDDMPFDQFTVEQIAGDLLPGATVEQRVATGFLRNGIKNREAGVKNEEKHFEEDDRPHQHDRHGVDGPDGRMRAVPRPQVRPDLAKRVLSALRAVQQRRRARHRSAARPARSALPARLSGVPRQARQDPEENGICELQAEWQRRIRRGDGHPGVNTDWDFHTTEWRAAHDRSDWKMRRPRRRADADRAR